VAPYGVGVTSRRWVVRKLWTTSVDDAEKVDERMFDVEQAPHPGRAPRAPPPHPGRAPRAPPPHPGRAPRAPPPHPGRAPRATRLSSRPTPFTCRPRERHLRVALGS